jgi:hypothetical protein
MHTALMLAALIAAGVAFYEVFVAAGALAHVRGMSAAGKDSLAVMKSTKMDDDEKSAAMLRASGAVFRHTGLIVVKTVAAAAAAGAVLFVAAMAFGGVLGWTFEGLVAFSLTWVGLIGVIVALTIYGKLRHGRG